VSATRLASLARSPKTAKFAPLVGALIGTLGAAAYWLSAQIWPSSVAVILSMALTAWLAAGTHSVLPATRFDLTFRLFCLLIKYNALMALSAAKLPFAAPPNAALGLIMICAHAASYALMIGVMSARPPPDEGSKLGSGTLSIALLLGLAPAAVLGIPGLSGLAAAIAVSLGVIAYLRLKGASAADELPGLAQQLGEASFYLGALATWSYV
jgi:adenosylcobinamide-GDP ribazoletransferase